MILHVQLDTLGLSCVTFAPTPRKSLWGDAHTRFSFTGICITRNQQSILIRAWISWFYTQLHTIVYHVWDFEPNPPIQANTLTLDQRRIQVGFQSGHRHLKYYVVSMLLSQCQSDVKIRLPTDVMFQS